MEYDASVRERTRNRSRRRQGAKRGAYYDDEEDDKFSIGATSTISRSTYGSAQDDGYSDSDGEYRNDDSDKPGDLFELEEQLIDKSAWVREEALTKIYKVLQTYDADSLTGSASTILERILRGSLKRGSVEEAALASRVIARTFINEGMDDDMIAAWPAVRDALLQRPIPDALEASAMACFIACEDDNDSLKYMVRLEKAFTRKSGGDALQVAAAIRSWSLVATTLPPRMLIQHVMEGEDNKAGLALRRIAVKGVKKGPGDKEARAAATSALTIILEVDGGLSDGDVDEYSDEDAHDGTDELGTTEEHSSVQSAASPRFLTMASVQQALDSISGELHASRRRIPKGERKWRRDLASEADTFSDPVQIVEVGNREVVELRGYVAKCRLDAFRRILGSGVTDHLAFNSLLRDIFELGDALERGVSANPRYKPNASRVKSRKQNRAYARQARTDAIDFA
eukprot:CAMPEP_0198729536 /NCGR_PEP_ID=MMETSP1475-20131203/19310_1 /TAXON_ID= ORGANISM="Unidentified sp., Strain CCMP1999" /NCGR_SAMPLE_ID=MMETSP1475 /ASSEMBLY_ACC=CAM_ASM_001111 /LENGTH=455 /DNA_ID=CAMNT_0044492213 /DNA_START=61 /DNA_END=1428 /DNA_ORIENTATION=-